MTQMDANKIIRAHSHNLMTMMVGFVSFVQFFVSFVVKT